MQRTCARTPRAPLGKYRQSTVRHFLQRRLIVVVIVVGEVECGHSGGRRSRISRLVLGFGAEVDAGARVRHERLADGGVVKSLALGARASAHVGVVTVSGVVAVEASAAAAIGGAGVAAAPGTTVAGRATGRRRDRGRTEAGITSTTLFRSFRQARVRDESPGSPTIQKFSNGHDSHLSSNGRIGDPAGSGILPESTDRLLRQGFSDRSPR